MIKKNYLIFFKCHIKFKLIKNIEKSQIRKKKNTLIYLFIFSVRTFFLSQHMNIILFPNKQTSKPKNFLRKQTHKKPKKFQLKNKIIKLKGKLFSNPAKSWSNPKTPKYQINPKYNTTNPNQKKKKKNLNPEKHISSKLKPSKPSKPTLSKFETHTNKKPNQQSPIRPTNQPKKDTNTNKPTIWLYHSWRCKFHSRSILWRITLWRKGFALRLKGLT